MSELKRMSKCVYVSLVTKLEALKRLDQGDIIQKAAFDLNIGAVTVCDWICNRPKIEEQNLKKCETNNKL